MKNRTTIENIRYKSKKRLGSKDLVNKHNRFLYYCKEESSSF